jgi:uncharacterized membrane protein
MYKKGRSAYRSEASYKSQIIIKRQGELSEGIQHAWLAVALLVIFVGLLTMLILCSKVSFLDLLRWLDSGICAQTPAHSFFPGGERLPLCARNTGIYSGFFITFVSLLCKRGKAQQVPPEPIMYTLLGGVVIMALDGFNSFLLDLGLPHFYQPSNLLRLATGLVTGLALAALALPMLNRECWKKGNRQQSIAAWSDLAMLIPALLLCFLAVASQSVYVLYPIAILSTMGLVIALGILNLVILVVIGKRDGMIESYRQLLPFIGLACACTIGELLLLAQLKLLLLKALGM